MSPADYYDWWFYSGICPGMPTRPANHAEMRQRLSAAGVHLIVLWELLRDNADLDETCYVAPHGIHGAHARLADAAREVGATGLAEFLSAPPTERTCTPETHRELKKLLKLYAGRRRGELAGDVARHGDARTATDFDKRQARRHRVECWSDNERRHQIADQIPFFAAPMKELEALLAQGLTLAEVSERNESMAQLASCFQYDFPRWSESPQPPEVLRFLEECRRLTEQYPQQMPPWGSAEKALREKYGSPKPRVTEVSADRDIQYQLYAIGPYQAERIGPLTIITWDSVPALETLFAPTGLRLTYQGEFPAHWQTAWSDTQRRFTVALPGMSQELLALARERLNDAELCLDDEQLLSQVTQGMLSISTAAHPTSWRVECSWDVEWEPELCCTFELNEHGAALRIE